MVAVDTFVESCFRVVSYATMLVVSILNMSELRARRGMRERPLELLVRVPIVGLALKKSGDPLDTRGSSVVFQVHVFFTVLSDGEAHVAALALVMHVGMSQWGREKMEDGL